VDGEGAPGGGLPSARAGDRGRPRSDGRERVFEGAPLGTEGRWVDPGEHRATASAPGHIPAELMFMVRAGEVVRLSTQLSPVVTETPITRRWWFWTALGVGVAGLATAVLVPLMQTDPPPYPGAQVQLP
ncbi:MAG: hypothetical protein KA978_30150, partial [Deltaproteobacteria bacterium]|nr:hypothetical protein [Deltaproteobacteria bacterium]